MELKKRNPLNYQVQWISFLRYKNHAFCRQDYYVYKLCKCDSG